MAHGERAPKFAGDETVVAPKMQLGVVTLLRLAEDQRDRVAEDVRAGKEFADGEIDFNGRLLEIYKGMLREQGVVMMPEDQITGDVLEGGDAELRINYGQTPGSQAA